MPALRRVILAATRVLADAGIEAARADAEYLACHLLGRTRGELILGGPVTADQVDRYQRLVSLRATRIPLQHLIGTAPFRTLELAVGPGVFIPRPETESLVEWGLSALSAMAPESGSSPLSAVDLCGGSGAIGISLAAERPGTRVWTVETSPEALSWLARNIERAPEPVTLVSADATSPDTLAELDGTVDLVLCNPPYVPLGTCVQPEVAMHDPAGAVFAGASGLDVIQAIIPRAAALLRPGGRVGIEHDDSHGPEVCSLMEGDGHWERIVSHRDLAGRPRFVTASRRR